MAQMGPNKHEWERRVLSRDYQGIGYDDPSMCTQVVLRFRNGDKLEILTHKKFLGELFWEDYERDLQQVTVYTGHLSGEKFVPLQSYILPMTP